MFSNHLFLITNNHPIQYATDWPPVQSASRLLPYGSWDRLQTHHHLNGEWMDGWTNGCVDGWMERWIDE